ncbi:hypothetical protein [Lacticaseibacillus kribbianus]|uniref:hypothetical protein n=1 Tax=Lacticaseibacillus kribbianus TaxID=2926292 RepID=UPI001CD7518D|nr:hypothetical protein [Lacticaseibacillus kribbianus]
MTQQLTVTKRYGPLRRLSLVTIGVLCAAIAFAPLAPVVVVAADAATTTQAAASGSTDQGDARATASAASATSVLDNGGQAAATDATGSANATDTATDAATESAPETAAEAAAEDATTAPAADTGDGAAAGDAETATTDATTETATDASTAPAAEPASPATDVTPLTPALQPLATPPVKAGPLADVTNLTDDEVGALTSLNDLFGASPWKTVPLLSDGSLNPAAYTTAVTGANTSLTAIANETNWPLGTWAAKDWVDMLFAPLFNATVKVTDSEGKVTEYTYADNTATGSEFFMMDETAFQSVYRDTQDSGVDAAPYTPLNATLTTGKTFADMAKQVEVYIDQAGRRLAKVMTTSDWEIADIATIDPVTGSISHRVYYKNLGATRSNIRLGSALDSSVADTTVIPGTVRFLTRLQVTADGYDGLYVTGRIYDGFKDNGDPKPVLGAAQDAALQPGGLIVYSDPVDPTRTEVYVTKSLRYDHLGDYVGLVSATGKDARTPVVGVAKGETYDTSIIYVSKPIPSLPTGGTIHLEYIERLSDKMTATKRYEDADTGAVLAHEDIVGNPTDTLNFTDTDTYIAQNPDVFAGYAPKPVSDNTDKASEETFQSSPGAWTVKLHKPVTYTPDNNPENLTLTTTAREFVEYLKDGQPYKPAELVKTIPLYRYATESSQKPGTYDYSVWTKEKVLANAHNVDTADLSFERLTQEQIDKYLPLDYSGKVTKLTINGGDPIAGDANADLSATTSELADWLETKAVDLTITRTVDYTPAKVGPIVPKDPSDPYYAMTHKALTVKVAIDDTALATADRTLVALGADGTQTIKFVRTVTYSGDTLLELGPWIVDVEGEAPDKLADVFKNVTAKPLEGYNITPGDTVTAESPVTAVDRVPATLVGQPISAALTAFAADDNGGVAGASALTLDGQDGTVTTELVYSMVMTYPAAGARAALWPAALAAALALGATGLLIGARRRRLR